MFGRVIGVSMTWPAVSAIASHQQWQSYPWTDTIDPNVVFGILHPDCQLTLPEELDWYVRQWHRISSY